MKLLFIGNSHTYFNDMPNTVKRLYTHHGLLTPDVTMLTVSGKDWAWHYSEPQTEFNIRYGNYDKIVLQDQAHPFLGCQHLFDDYKAILPALQLANGNTEICLYMTWSEKVNPNGFEVMCSSYEKLAAEYNTLLAPVGRIWKAVLEEDNTTPLYWEDGEHASVYGSFLAAMTIFNTLSRVALSEDACVKLACEQNLDIEIAKMLVRKAKEILG